MNYVELFLPTSYLIQNNEVATSLHDFNCISFYAYFMVSHSYTLEYQHKIFLRYIIR